MIVPKCTLHSTRMSCHTMLLPTLRGVDHSATSYHVTPGRAHGRTESGWVTATILSVGNLGVWLGRTRIGTVQSAVSGMLCVRINGWTWLPVTHDTSEGAQ